MTTLEALRLALSTAVANGDDPELVKVLTRECFSRITDSKRPQFVDLSSSWGREQPRGDDRQRATVGLSLRQRGAP